jgi:hypothetical protein
MSFARHSQTFKSLAATLRNKAEELVRLGRGDIAPRVNLSVLETPVDLFIEQTPSLRKMKAAIEHEARDPERWGLLLELENFLEGRTKAGARELASRKPDIVEFFLDRSEIVITDVTTATTSVHSFKTAFYREVMSALVGETPGLRVYALDLNVADKPIPTSIVFD